METLNIMSGFQSIRSEFRSKVPDVRNKLRLELWFTFKNEMLCVHDIENHSASMLLAIYSSDVWNICIDPDKPGARLLREVVHKWRAHELQDKINEIYNDYGDKLPSRL